MANIEKYLDIQTFSEVNEPEVSEGSKFKRLWETKNKDDEC